MIDIIHDPSRFLSFVRDKIKKAKCSITISALYIGTSDIEKLIVNDLHEALEREKDLKVTMLFDYSRAQRNPNNSLEMLEPILSSFHSRCRVFLYQCPQQRSWPWRLLPSPYNEIIGVYHCKFLIFDSDVILTGANLSDEYFCNRQDRYMCIHGCQSLANFLNRITSVILRHSFKAVSPTKVIAPIDCDDNSFRKHMSALLRENSQLPLERDTSQLQCRYDATVHNSAAQSTNRVMGSSVHVSSGVDVDVDVSSSLGFNADSTADSFLVPVVQMAAAGLTHEEALLPALLRSHWRWHQLALCTPYPSFPAALSEAIQCRLRASISPPSASPRHPHSLSPALTNGNERCEGHPDMSSTAPARTDSSVDKQEPRPLSVHILTPANTSHGFAATTGLRSLIPLLHEAVFEESLSACSSPPAAPPITEKYARRGWTFHAKGLWLSRRMTKEERQSRIYSSMGTMLKADNQTVLPTASVEHSIPSMRCPSAATKPTICAQEEPSEDVHVTYIGSSNLSERSWARDFELGFLLVTRESSLQRMLHVERKHLWTHSVPYIACVSSSSVWIKLLAKACRYLKLL